MMCPHCEKELEFKPYVIYNVDCYRNPVIGKTQCCGKGLKVSAVTTIKVAKLTEYDGVHTVDSWGEVLE